MPKTKIVVIGAGFAGLAAAACLAQMGHQVTLLEKNSSPGGRARRYQSNGFTFDMGPSWYWMPDVFESFFNKFGKKSSDYYQLRRLDPSYKVVFGKDDEINVPAQMAAIEKLFEQYEPGSSKKLQEFLRQAAYKYEVGINQLVYKPGRSLTEYMDPQLLLDVFRMDVFQSFSKHVRRYFKNDKLLRLLEFPILFLGALPENTPALYSLMNYADIGLGTWYPIGGMYEIVAAMEKLAIEQGVKINYNEPVEKLEITHGEVTRVITTHGVYETDVVVAGADYNHVEQRLLAKEHRNYSERYWESRVMAPSSLIFYLGINKKLKNLHHHNLFFDEDFGPHARDIYINKRWPDKPLFYVSAPSVTDASVAPEGSENLFILIPVAPGLEDNEQTREHYYNLVMNRLEHLTGQQIREAVVHKRSYAHHDFTTDYNAFKGNAYGLANTLRQTAMLKPSLKSSKVDNLYYTGQLTVPGPGVPPSLISGQVVAREVHKDIRARKAVF